MRDSGVVIVSDLMIRSHLKQNIIVDQLKMLWLATQNYNCNVNFQYCHTVYVDGCVISIQEVRLMGISMVCDAGQ